jgi:hypothetical protein
MRACHPKEKPQPPFDAVGICASGGERNLELRVRLARYVDSALVPALSGKQSTADHQT